MDVREEIVKEARALRRHTAAREKSRLRLAELFRVARAEEDGPGPAEIAELVERIYTPDHISRISLSKPEEDAPKKRRRRVPGTAP